MSQLTRFFPMHTLDPTIALQLHAELLLLTAEMEGVAIETPIALADELTTKVRTILNRWVPQLDLEIRVRVGFVQGAVEVTIEPYNKQLPYLYPEDF